MKILLVITKIVLMFVLSGCFGANRIYTEFSNIKNTPVDEENVAVIYNDFPEASHAWCINDIYFLNKSTGKFEAIYHDTDLKPDHFTRKFLLLPGTYNIFYSFDYYGTREEADKGHGKVNLKAGHKYRVEHQTCDGSFHRKFCTSGILFKDVTTGELLSGKRRKFVFEPVPQYYSEVPIFRLFHIIENPTKPHIANLIKPQIEILRLKEFSDSDKGIKFRQVLEFFHTIKKDGITPRFPQGSRKEYHEEKIIEPKVTPRV